MRYQKGLNSNRNHHDSLSQSGAGRNRSDSYAKGSRKSGGYSGSRSSSPYGQGKHSKGGRPKQSHW